MPPPKADKAAEPGKAPAGGAEMLPPPNPGPPGEKPNTVLVPPALEEGEEGLPITLPAALKLADAQAWDIIIATQQLQVAVAQLQGANVLWLPTLQFGTDYQYHSGPIQETQGPVIQQNHSNLYAGGAPLALFPLTDAIFEPLAQRQVVRAETANIQTSRNDTLTNMAQVYFDLLEAEADLAGILDVDERAARMVTKAEGLAPGLIPEVEVARVKAAKANFEDVVELARQRWRDSSAEVARVTRLKPTVVLQPLEPPQLRMTLVAQTPRPDDLLSIAMANRPELTFEEAQAEAARERLRQERWRPLLPIIVMRGGGTVPPDAMAFGAFAGGTNGDIGHFSLRSDWDIGAYWEFRNLGLGNRALIRQRKAEYEVARSNEYRFQDLVAKEVTQAWVDVRSAERRLQSVAMELQQAELSARQNLLGLGEVKRPQAGINILVIRPLEVVAALQALQAAYFDYFGVSADYNRAQFRLYRAIGSPAQALAGHDGVCGPALPADASQIPPDAAKLPFLPEGPGGPVWPEQPAPKGRMPAPAPAK